MAETALIIGSRGSQLALWQSRHVASLLAAPCEIRVITTSGDRFLSASPTGRLEKGFFTKEIEEELLAGRIDIAVHSLKDLPTQLAPGLALGAIGAREAVMDLLLVQPDWVGRSRAVPVRSGGRVGATSLRRQSMIRAFSGGDLEPAVLRGNVPTRVEKCRRGDYAAVILAAAGVRRLELDLSGLAVYELDPQVWLPAPGQAALGIEIRAGDDRASRAVTALDDAAARRCVTIERELLHRFEGGCHEAFGAWARSSDGEIIVSVGHEDARGRWRSAVVRGSQDDVLVERAFSELKALMASEPAATPTPPFCRRVA